MSSMALSFRRAPRTGRVASDGRECANASDGAGFLSMPCAPQQGVQTSEGVARARGRHTPQPQTPRSQLPVSAQLPVSTVSGEERQCNENGMILRARNLPVPDYSPGQRQLRSQRERGSWLADAWFLETRYLCFCFNFGEKKVRVRVERPTFAES